MPKRSPDESLDNVALFFESVASAVKESGGVFVSDNLTVSEAQRIFRICRAQARDFRAEADQLRTTSQGE